MNEAVLRLVAAVIFVLLALFAAVLRVPWGYPVTLMCVAVLVLAGGE